MYAQNYYPQIASRFTVGVPLLGHTWTLAIEEQFYWLWPLAVSVLRGRRLVIVLVAAMCIAPVACLLFLSLTAGNPYAALSALPSQLDLLASGAIVAVAIRSAVPAGTIIRAGQAASALGALLLRGRRRSDPSHRAVVRPPSPTSAGSATASTCTGRSRRSSLRSPWTPLGRSTHQFSTPTSPCSS